LPGTEALIRKEGDTLIIQPKPLRKKNILDVLREFGPLDEPFPDVDDSDLPPLRAVDLE
jgi:antitoxin VapB